MPNRRYSPRTHAIVNGDPATLIGEPPTVQLCINQEWIPFLTGALEVLSADDYWENPDVAVPQVENLIASLGLAAPTPCSECPDFVMDYDFDEPGQTFPYFETLTTVHCTEAFPDVVWGWCEPAFIGGISKCAFKFVQGTSLVGIRVKEFAAMAPTAGIGQTWDFQWDDCIGGPYVDIHPGSQHLKTNFVVKRWSLSSLTPFMFVLSLAPGIACSTA